MKRVKLTKWQLFNHYLIPISIIVLPIISFGYTYWEIEISKTYSGVRTLEEISFILYFPIVGILCLIIKYTRLNFKEIKSDISENELKKTLSRFKKENELTLIKKESTKTIFRSHNFSTNYGKLITICIEKDRVLFNEICFPEFGLNGFSLGILKKELKSFLHHINDIKRGVPYSKPKHYTNNQWSLKMILIRLFLYPLSIFFVSFSILYLFKTNFFLVLIISTISLIYLFSDLYMILKNKAVNKS